MHASKFYLVFSSSVVLFSVAHADYTLQELNNVISQHVLTRTAKDSYVASQPKQVAFTASKKTLKHDPVQILSWQTHGITMEQYHDSIIIKQEGFERSLHVPENWTIRKAWFNNCQSIGIAYTDERDQLKTDSYRVCHIYDLVGLNIAQQELLCMSVNTLKDGDRFLIRTTKSYETYCTLPEHLQRLFILDPSVRPVSVPAIKIATILSVLLGGYISFV
jgi:hypothetical protein